MRQRKRIWETGESGLQREPRRPGEDSFASFEDFVRGRREELAKWAETRRNRRQGGAHGSPEKPRRSD